MFEQVKLNYSFDALEPHIDALTMETHYAKHHATYTKNFNDLVAKLPQFAGRSAEDVLSNLSEVPEDMRAAVRNNGGGYYNHNLYFEALSPNGGGEPTGKLLEQINKDFGSFENLKAELTKAATGQFGSGWAWLIVEDGKLKITATSNQDSPIMNGNHRILLPIDVWEHAYYLKYKNLRGDHVKALFNVVDWKALGEKFEKFI